MKKFFKVLLFAILILILKGCDRNKLLTIEELPYTRVWDFQDGLALARIPGNVQGVNSLYGFVNEEGVWVIPPQFSRVNQHRLSAMPTVPAFHEGLAAVAVYNIFSRQHMYGFINTDGEWVIEPQFYDAHNFRDGAAVVFYIQDFSVLEVFTYTITGEIDISSIEAGYVVIDRDGNFIVEPGRYAAIFPFIEDGTALVTSPIFAEEMTMGIINTRGEELVPLSRGYRYIMPFYSRDYASVQSQEEKWGAINRDFELVVPFISDSALSFFEGLSMASVDGLFGYVDTHGQWVIEPQFDSARSFSEGLAAVKVGDLWTYVNRTGEMIMPPQITDNNPPRFENGLATVTINRRTVTINTSGEIVN
jgi:hypothetical protein